jgi:hypothetical protein
MLAGTTALAATALAVLALRPSSRTAPTLAARNPVVEVRTEVIRRTIHIVKHVSTPGTRGGSVAVQSGRGAPPIRTSTSRHSPVGSTSAGAVVTRTSRRHSSGTGLGTIPVTTRTSPHAGGSSSGSGSGALTTRTSPHGNSSNAAVRTRTSASGGDGGDGSGGDN